MRTWLVVCGVVSGMMAVGDRVAAADDPSKETSVIKTRTQEGLHFRVPEDWPIEKRGGVVGPIPLEEYVAKKLSAIEARLKSLEQQVGGLDVRVRVLEEAVKQQNQLRSAGSQP